MYPRTAERRRGQRVAAAHPVTLRTPRGGFLLRGRTASISESGLLCLTECRRALQVRGRVVAEVVVPGGRSPRAGRPDTRTVRYEGRIVRVEEIGQFVSVAVALTRKL